MDNLLLGKLILPFRGGSLARIVVQRRRAPAVVLVKPITIPERCRK